MLVTTEELSVPLIRFDIIHELTVNSKEYGMSPEDLVYHLQKAIPGANNINAVVSLLQEKAFADLCEVKTTRKTLSGTERISYGSL